MHSVALVAGTESALSNLHQSSKSRTVSLSAAYHHGAHMLHPHSVRQRDHGSNFSGRLRHDHGSHFSVSFASTGRFRVRVAHSVSVIIFRIQNAWRGWAVVHP